MERRYETVFIINPDVGEEATKGIVKKAASALEKYQGKDVLVTEWGRRKLAYRIKKKAEGHYVLIAYTSEAPAGKELERLLRYNESVLRYQTVVVKKRPSVKAPAEPAVSQDKGA